MAIAQKKLFGLSLRKKIRASAMSAPAWKFAAQAVEPLDAQCTVCR